jgi:hypothetical protein
MLLPILAGFIMLYIILSEHRYFNGAFSKIVVAMALTAVFFMLIHLTLHLRVQFYFFAKFGVKTTAAEAGYLEPLLGTFIGVGVIKWYPLNELWDVPDEKRKEALFAYASRILGRPYNEKR